MKKLLPTALLLAALALTACSGKSGMQATPTSSTVPLPTETPAENDAPVDSEIGVDVGGGTGSIPEPDVADWPQPNLALREKVDAIYQAYPLDPMSVETTIIDLTDESWYTYHTGLDAAQIAKVNAALVSEPMTGSQAYSLVIAQVKDKADAQTIADAMLAGIAMDKWVCVQADRARVVTFGDTVLFVMADSELVDVDELLTAAADALGVTFDCDVSRAATVD